MRTPSYKKRRNASIISLSPQFNEAIRLIRSYLSVPAEGFNSKKEMNEWYQKHHSKYSKEQYRSMPTYYWHFPREIVDLIESFNYSDEPSRVNYYQDVPLDRYAMEIIRKFDLPEEILNQVKAYILGAVGPLGVGSLLPVILIPVDEDNEGRKYTAFIAGIDESSSQKEWLEVWKSIQAVLRLSGVGETPHKRQIDSIFLRDLGFWTQAKKGKSARQIAEDWIKKHPDEGDYPVEDMIRKAVDRIENLMRPSS